MDKIADLEREKVEITENIHEMLNGAPMVNPKKKDESSSDDEHREEPSSMDEFLTQNFTPEDMQKFFEKCKTINDKF